MNRIRFGNYHVNLIFLLYNNIDILYIYSRDWNFKTPLLRKVVSKLQPYHSQNHKLIETSDKVCLTLLIDEFRFLVHCCKFKPFASNHN